MKKQETIHHSVSGINEYFVECYYRHTERVWVFKVNKGEVTKECSHPSQEHLNICYDGDLMKWREAHVTSACECLLTQRALIECDYCASKKAQRVNYKLSKIHTIKRISAPCVVDALFAKHLLERGDYACLYEVTVNWNCDAYYTKTK